MSSLSQQELSDLRESVGTHQPDRRLSPSEAAKLIKKWTTAQSLDGLSREVNLKDSSVLRKLVSLLELPDDIREFVTWGKKNGCISFTIASEIARLDAIEDQRHLFSACRDQKLSKDAIRNIVRTTKSKQLELREAIAKYR